MQKKNYSVEVFRFVFCVFIVNYHFFSHFLRYVEFPNYFCRSYMGDEFFFIVTGFFLMEAAMRTDKKPLDFSLSQLGKRIKKIALPYYLVWVLCFIGRHVTASLLNEPQSIVKNLANSIYELSFLEMFGFAKGFYSNDVGWFFSALLIVTFLLSPFAAKYKKTFALFIAPLIACFCYGMLSTSFDYLFYPHKIIPNTHIMKGLVRALASISMGAFVNGVVNADGFKLFWSKHPKLRSLVSVFDLAVWAVILAYMAYPFSSNSVELTVQYDFICAIVMVIAMIPVMAGMLHFGKSKDEATEENKTAPSSKTAGQKVATFLGKYAFYAYFGQAVYYSIDDYVYKQDIKLRWLFLILHGSVLVTTLLLAVINQSFIKSRKKHLQNT